MKFVRLLNDNGVIYQSYTDYWELVRLSGFETIEQNEVHADTQGTLIFPINSGNSKAMVNRPRKFKAICHQLERPVGSPANLVPGYWDEVWLSDRWIVDQCKTHHPNVKYVPIGGHPELGRFIKDRPIEYDFAVMAYLWGHRGTKVHQLRDGGYRIAPSGWGEGRDKALAASRMGLCLHQDHNPILEPLRYTLFACWGLPLVCDPCYDYHPYKVYRLHEIDKAQRDSGEENHSLLTTDMTFRRCIERALCE